MIRRTLAIAAALLPLVCVAQTGRTVTLMECLDSAAAGNMRIRNSRLDVLASDARAAEARWEFMPRVSLNVYGYRAFRPLIDIGIHDVVGGSDDAVNLAGILSDLAYMHGIRPALTAGYFGYGATALVLQPVFAGGRIINGNRLAAMASEAARIQHGLDSMEISSEIERKYWQVVSLQEKMLTLLETEKMLNAIAHDVEGAVGAGLATRAQMQQVAQKQKELSGAKVQLRSGIRLAKMDLFDAAAMSYHVLGLDSLVFEGSLDGMPPPEEVEIPEESLARFPESRLLEMNERGQRLQKRMAVGELLPQVAVGVGYGYNDLISFGGKWNGIVFGTVQIPITDIGKAVLRSKRYGYAVQKAENERAFYDSQLLLKSRMLFIKLQAAWEGISLAESALEIARSTAGDVHADVQAGRATYTDYLRAATEDRKAADELMDAKIAYKKALVDYSAHCRKCPRPCP